MKKILFFCSLITIVGFSHVLFSEIVQASSENKPISEEVSREVNSSSESATSKASIGFSSKSSVPGGKDDGNNGNGGGSGNNGNNNNGDNSGASGSNGLSPVTRLPTTGESIGMGVSFLGLMLIIIIFRKELKDIIKKDSRGKKQNEKDYGKFTN